MVRSPGAALAALWPALQRNDVLTGYLCELLAMEHRRCVAFGFAARRAVCGQQCVGVSGAAAFAGVSQGARCQRPPSGSGAGLVTSSLLQQCCHWPVSLFEEP